MKFDFAEIQVFVTDLRESVKFYSETLGIPVSESSQDWAILNFSGIEMVLMAGAHPVIPKNDYGKGCETILCIKHKNLDECHPYFLKSQVNIVKEIQETPFGRYMVISDPSGNYIEIIEPKDS